MAYAYAVVNALAGLSPANFTFSSVPANLGFLNDGRMDRRTVFAGAVASGYNVIINMGSAVPLAGLAVLNSNFALQKTDAKVLIEAADNAGMSVNLITVKALSTLNTAAPKQKDHVFQFATQTKQYWRITWSWTTGTVVNPGIGELFAYAPTAVTQLSRKGVYGGIGETEELLIAKVDFQGDTLALFLGGPIREKQLRFADLNTTQRDEALTMFRATNGPVTPLLWIESYEATATAAAVTEQDCIYGRNTIAKYHWAETDFALYQPDDYSIRSLGREAGN